MTNRRIVLILAFASLGLAQNRDQQFGTLADRYFDDLVFRYDPVQATQAGFHQYDAQLPSGTREEVRAEIAALHGFEDEVVKFSPAGLSPFVGADR